MVKVIEVQEVKKVILELSPEDAFLFSKFQQRYELIAPIVGYMDALGLLQLKNMMIQIDLDKSGRISHTSITQHYRPLE